MTGDVINNEDYWVHCVDSVKSSLVNKVRTDFLDGVGKEAAVYIFERFDLIDEFSIFGYIPLFNDGEPCEYTQHVEIQGDNFSAIRPAIDALVRIFSDLSGVLGNNFELKYKIHREYGNEIEWVLSDYECGY